MEGFVSKKGYFLRKWQVLWFSLDNGEIRYFLSQSKNSYKGRYQLYPNTSITKHDVFDGQENVILLLSERDQGLYFSLESPALLNQWLDSLVNHIGLIRAKQINSAIDLHTEGYYSPPAVMTSRTASNNSNITMEGYATKRGHFIPNWKVRWFHLENGCISYYEDKTKQKLKGRFLLYEDTNVLRHTDIGNYRNVVHLFSSKDRGLYFSLDSFETKEAWIEGLLKHIENINTDYLYDSRNSFMSGMI